ncbi:hypothetical protein Agabi119p4_9015 [Agaricus bisporus var. burnettii]|uniref:Uncharacterized protein n=1 Tax=Agaricus bisporus var. burnettii TaxID=192524 RepID=A0A8H7C4J4_AGABI|nr:hypothetical protein Agabi119p4_9015 [Agaricus bisporus var. burnettii]
MYILVGPIVSADWTRFQKAVRGVESYHVIKDSGKEPLVSAGVFAQIVSKLNGEPFFPNLTTLHIVNLENFLKHYPFLLSQQLQTVSADLPYTWVNAKSVAAFLQALVSLAPEVTFLSIVYAKPLAFTYIGAINNLTCLRTLEINRLANLQETADIFASLKALDKLEELKLTIEDSAPTWCPAQNARFSPALGSTNPLTIETYLESLQSLCIKGPSQIISEFLDFLRTPDLVSLSITSTCWLHVSAQPGHELLDANERRTQMSYQSSSPRPARVQSQACMAACTIAHLHSWTVTRWSKSLENLTIRSCDRTTFDLSGISKHEALRNLDIKGGTTPIGSLLSSGIPVFNPLRTLGLSSSASNLTLFELDEIASRSPSLLKLSSSFYIGSESELDSLAEVEPLSHPLKELTMERAILKDVGSHTFLLASKIARRLHLLFPNLARLDYPPGESRFWEDVWQILQLFQKIALDEKRRHKLATGVSETCVMTDDDRSSRNSGLEYVTAVSADCKLRE